MKATAGNELKILSFKTPGEFEKWLAKNHNKANGIWLRLFKKGCPELSISYNEALDEALCYGWIDGQKNGYDDISWLQKFTPRRPNSIWSKKNTNNIERLAAAKKMQPPGLKEVEKAKADGRWSKAYDSPGKMQIPPDLLKKLSGNKKAAAFFESLNKTNKYAIAWRLQTAKTSETREKRLKAILEMLLAEKKFH